MITFIIFLKAMAAIVITNSHYVGIYPLDIIANGGLIGDILFFVVSGYCLTNTNKSFGKWYAKRLLRIIPTTILITVVFIVLKQYSLNGYASGTETTFLYSVFNWLNIRYPTWLSWFVYPTNYHFVSSILVLYIPYYFLLKNKFTRQHLTWVMLAVFVVYLVIYLFVYDKSYYHIDTVREPFIRFLFLESMLLGAYFKFNDEKFRNKGNPVLNLIAIFVFAVVYFVIKMLLSGGGGSKRSSNSMSDFNFCFALFCF